MITTGSPGLILVKTFMLMAAFPLASSLNFTESLDKRHHLNLPPVFGGMALHFSLDSTHIVHLPHLVWHRNSPLSQPPTGTHPQLHFFYFLPRLLVALGLADLPGLAIFPDSMHNGGTSGEAAIRNRCD